MYTDKQRQEIAEEEYSEYKVGNAIKIGPKDSKVTIGYVAEVEKTGSGFKAYVITDTKLPKNPTQEQLDKEGYKYVKGR